MLNHLQKHKAFTFSNPKQVWKTYVLAQKNTTTKQKLYWKRRTKTERGSGTYVAVSLNHTYKTSF